jgi:hypothetical protein
MIPTLLLMLSAGIALSQAASDPNAVTLRWLRLGGLISTALLAVAGFALVFAGDATVTRGLAVACVAVLAVAQLLAVQLGRRRTQRGLAAATFIAGVAAAAVLFADISTRSDALRDKLLTLTPTLALSAGLLGGFLMTMLLGHAYLAAGNEMTQAPFRRLTLMLAVLLALRAVGSIALGLLPWLNAPREGSPMWAIMIMTARYAVGLLAPGLFAYMTYDCVRRRANQSATGILYVATVLVIIGEWSAWSLFDRTLLGF